MSTSHLLAAARGDHPAEVALRNARVVNVFSGEIEHSDVVVSAGVIVGVGADYDASTEVDLGGAFLLPGFIDAHVHVESSLVTPFEMARAVVPRGTTTVVSDPHEIANVHGLEGIRFMLDASEGLPLSVLVMASSCVPATPMGTAGASLGARELLELVSHPRVIGLAEVMNFPGVISGDPDMLEKIAAFQRDRLPIDGHAPRVSGQALSAYVLAGPSSDHESTTADEAREKIARGVFLFLREATNARNLRDLLPALTPSNLRRAAFCTDDRTPADLLDEGGIDMMVRAAIASGIPPVEAIRMATLNPAEHFGLRDRGAVAPGRQADLIVVEDLEALAIREVWSGGVKVAAGGKDLGWPRPSVKPPAPSMRVDVERLSFRIGSERGPATASANAAAAPGGRVALSGQRRARVIRIIPDQIVTGRDEEVPTGRDGEIVADPARDLLKIAVIERHTGSGRVGLGLVRGMGLRSGAMASTVAHDHHNLIVIGADDASMAAAAAAVVEMGGGLAVTAPRGPDPGTPSSGAGPVDAHAGAVVQARTDVQVVATVPLRIGGLMSDAPIEEVRAKLDRATAAVRALGSPLHDPFMAMSFLGLEVIPSLKITDFGVVDVDAFSVAGLWV